MKVNFVNYSDHNYESNRQKLNQMGEREFDKVFSYSPSDIDESFYIQNKKILDLSRGAGYWLWKPYFIYRTLMEVEEGDIVFYLDSGDFFTSGICAHLKSIISEKDMILVPSSNKQRCYTKRDCFVLMGMDTEEFWDATRVEAGIIAIKNNDNGRALVDEWLNWAKNENIITDLDNICGEQNFDCFQDHRHDQSIISNMAKKYDICLDNSIRRWVTCNVVVKNA